MQRLTMFVLLLVSFLHSQTNDELQYQYAHQLYGEEKYFEAITEAKRLLLFKQSEENDFNIYLLIGNCYRGGAKFSEALRYFLEAEKSAKNIQQLFTSKIEAIKIHILRRTSTVALKYLDEMLNDEKFHPYKEELIYWKGWAYIFDDDWKNASATFKTLTKDCTELIKLCDSVENQKYSVSFAKTISVVIPGVGQFYTGNYLSGLLSFTYNAGLIYITANAFLAERIFDGIIVSNFLLLRFYNGNIHNAASFALEKNLKINNDALNYLQFEFKGIKP